MPTTYREAMCVYPDNVTVKIRQGSIVAILAGLSLFVVTACSTQEVTSEEAISAPASPIVITNEQVAYPEPAMDSWPDESAQRIVALANGSGEIIAALGAADRVVGRDETSSSPDIASAPIVTDGHAVNAEQVIALNPDVVIIDADTSPPEALDQIRETGVNVIEVPQAWSPAEVAQKTEAIGNAMGAPAGATTYVKDLVSATTNDIQPVGNRVAFLYLRGTSAIYLLGGVGSGADSLIAESGAIDVGAEAGLAPFTPLTAEELINLNPDTILVMTNGLESVGGPDGLFDLPGVGQTIAAKDRRLVAVDDTLLLSFGPRTGALIKALNTAWQQLGSPKSL